MTIRQALDCFRDDYPDAAEAIASRIEALESDMAKLRSCGLALQLGLRPGDVAGKVDNPSPAPEPDSTSEPGRKCPRCLGDGKEWGGGPAACPACHGTGAAPEAKGEPITLGGVPVVVDPNAPNGLVPIWLNKPQPPQEQTPTINEQAYKTLGRWRDGEGTRVEFGFETAHAGLKELLAERDQLRAELGKMRIECGNLLADATDEMQRANAAEDRVRDLEAERANANDGGASALVIVQQDRDLWKERALNTVRQHESELEKLYESHERDREDWTVRAVTAERRAEHAERMLEHAGKSSDAAESALERARGLAKEWAERPLRQGARSELLAAIELQPRHSDGVQRIDDAEERKHKE